MLLLSIWSSPSRYRNGGTERASVSQIRSDLTVVAGTGGVTCDAYLGNHVHLQEGAENIGDIIDMVTSLGSWGPHSPEWCHPTD